MTRPHFTLLAMCLLVATVGAADTCSDVRPRSGEGFKLGPPCADVVARGDCGADWVKKSIKELPEGYCQVCVSRVGRGARCERPSVVEVLWKQESKATQPTLLFPP